MNRRVRIEMPPGEGMHCGHMTRCFDIDTGEEIQGVTAIDIRIRVDALIAARVDATIYTLANGFTTEATANFPNADNQ